MMIFLLAVEPDAGYWSLDTGYWSLDTGLWDLDKDKESLCSIFLSK